MTASSSNTNQEQLNKIIDEHRSLAFEQGSFGACLLVNNNSAKARISLFGAHLLSYVPAIDKRERLWLSDLAIFDNSTPIRGGVPICWPWFGAHKQIANAPSHGFARTQVWQLASVDEEQDANGRITKTKCRFVPSQLGLFGMPQDCKVNLSIVIGKTCELTLATENRSTQTIALSQAIHSYFSVNDINRIEIIGIHEPFFNKLDGTMHNKCPSPYKISAETDRVHSRKLNDFYEQTQEISLVEGKEKILGIFHSGHNGTVVWNPWINKSQGMRDMSDSGYQTMLCIEAVTEPEVPLEPGQQHVLTQRFT